MGKIAIVTGWDQATRVSLQSSPLIVDEPLFAFHAFVIAGSSGGDFGKLSVGRYESGHQPPRRPPCAGAFGAPGGRSSPDPPVPRRRPFPSPPRDRLPLRGHHLGDTTSGTMASLDSGLRCQRGQRWARGKDFRGPTRERIATASKICAHRKPPCRVAMIDPCVERIHRIGQNRCLSRFSSPGRFTNRSAARQEQAKGNLFPSHIGGYGLLECHPKQLGG